MEHYKPHPGATFEGYYSKFELPSGAHLALIICTVPQAKKRPHMISFTYVPHDRSQIFQREIWVDKLDMIPKSHGAVAFEQHFPDGHVICHADSTTEYDLSPAAFTFRAKTTSAPVAWMPDMDTPEGLAVKLPLPLHWHVQTLSSTVDFTLDIPGYDLPAVDAAGTATVHQEKNWANSFPAAHIWVQARNGDRGICIAGGRILGLDAFLLGYHAADPRFSTYFRPPLSVKAMGLSPTMGVEVDWEERRFELSVQSWRRKVVVKAQAPKGTFFSLSSPFPDGHKENFCSQSFRAEVKVQVYEAGWFGPWKLAHEESFDGASLEFAAGYYPPAGSDERHH